MRGRRKGTRTWTESVAWFPRAGKGKGAVALLEILPDDVGIDDFLHCHELAARSLDVF